MSTRLSPRKLPFEPGRRISLVSSAEAPRSSQSDLVARLKAGDEDAAHVFFDRYAARIHRFIANSLGADVADADDVLQETFIALADGRHTLRSHDRPSSA